VPKAKPTTKSLKNKCWKLFSEWVRRRDADEGGTVYCVTCRIPIFWKEAHAGHFVPGRTNAVLFHPEITNPQCPVCNLWRGGNYQAYTLYMLDKYGRAKVDEFLALRRQVKKFTRADLEGLIEEYKNKLTEMNNDRPEQEQETSR
jgi:hypothetical protein